MAANSIFWKLSFEPEQLESSISPLFLLSQSLGLWFFDISLMLKDHLYQEFQDGRRQHLEKKAFETEHL